ncbi:MAG TPA: hypoxanthine phosphoribosyltransferase, partial [Calditrichae bacterium]|nr:hypoxanthine phosphoribosyltransferase [Calditrichia bacterium]
MITPDTIQIDDLTFEILIDSKTLHKRIEELGKQISRDYEGKIPIMIGVLNGAAIFLADIIR